MTPETRQMQAPVTFTDPAAAKAFCRAVGYPMGGTGFDKPELWIKRANAWAARIAKAPANRLGETGVQIVARVVAQACRSKGATFAAVPCQRCAALLTAPQSIAAGIGPECMAK